MRPGCELWMHPAHAHATRAASDPERVLARRVEVARHSGVPDEAIRRYESSRRGRGLVSIAEAVLPDRELRDGVEVETDVGALRVVETPGHAPSHVVLHHPDHGLLLSGDHLLGRVSLYYDYGYTPDPAGEFLASLDVVGGLDVRLVLAGHGRPRRDAPALVEANRREVKERLGRVQSAIETGPCTPYEIVPALLGVEDPSPMLLNWGLSEVLCYLQHLELEGAAKRLAGDGPDRWTV